MQGRLFPKYLDQLQVFPINTWQEEFDMAKNIGFEHIELLWDSKKEIKSATGLAEFVIDKSKLPPLSMCVDSISKYILLEDILSEILDVIDTFKSNTPPILVIPLLGKAEIKTVNRLKELIIKLNNNELINLIKKYKIKLALELDMPAKSIIEALKVDNHECIGICIDSGNLWYYSSNPINDIYLLSAKIIHVHIKDKDKKGNNVLLGKGMVNFTKFFNVLKNINYSGIVTLETKYFIDPLNEAKKNLQFFNGVYR